MGPARMQRREARCDSDALLGGSSTRVPRMISYLESSSANTPEAGPGKLLVIIVLPSTSPGDDPLPPPLLSTRPRAAHPNPPTSHSSTVRSQLPDASSGRPGTNISGQIG